MSQTQEAEGTKLVSRRGCCCSSKKLERIKAGETKEEAAISSCCTNIEKSSFSGSKDKSQEK